MALGFTSGARHRLPMVAFPALPDTAPAATPRVAITASPVETLTDILGETVPIPRAPRHEKAWAWLGSLRRGEKPAAFIGNWARGGAKSTVAELGVVECGFSLRRRFVLYVSGTQDQADLHVQSIATLLEQAGEARAVNAYGSSKGWTGKLLRTSRGFNVLSVGLDKNLAGAKLGDLRPDLIVIDDVDDRDDSPTVTQRKLRRLTQTVLPAGSVDCAVLFIQNRVHRTSIMSLVLDGKTDILLRRVVSDEPAIRNLVYEVEITAEGIPRYIITGGEATWEEGQSMATCQAQINEWGISAFLTQSQHIVEEPDGGLFSHLVYRHITADAVPSLVRVGVWCDPAVTNTDHSDCNGIQCDGMAGDGTIYRLASWEQRSTPQEVLCRAIIMGVRWGAEVVGVETDQGGETWQSVYNETRRFLTTPDIPAPTDTLATLRRVFVATWEERDEMARMPVFRSAKAGSAAASKVERATRMLAAYERGGLVHVIGTHHLLEAALRRFPAAKPYDLVDAAYWSWHYLSGGGRSNSAVGAFG